MSATPLPSPPGNLGSRRWRDDDPVVLRPANPNHPVPTFKEDRWPLHCVWESGNRAEEVLTFGRFVGWRKLMAKELMATRINVPTRPSREGRIGKGYKPKTLVGALSSLDRAFRFLEAEGVAHVSDLTPEVLDRYVRMVLQLPIQPLTKIDVLRIFVWLWESGPHLTDGGLSFNPFGGLTLRRLIGYETSDETITPRIPADVVGGLLRWAIAYVDDFSTDIIAAARAYDAKAAAGIAPRSSIERLTRYVDELRATGQPLPAAKHGGRTTLCTEIISTRAGVHRSFVNGPSGRAVLERGIADLGMDLRCLGPTTHVPDGCTSPWRPAMTIDEMKRECRNLISACYIVCAYLSGMRDYELQAMRRGCLEEHRGDGEPSVQYRVASLAGKQLKEARHRTWVVIEPVARAIRVLEELLGPLHGASGEDHLFIHMHYGVEDGRRIGPHVNECLRRFMAHCSDVLAPALRHVEGAEHDARATARLSAIPDGPDGRWHLNSSQFRKTLAWHIANRKFGIVAGAIQYGHASLRMFEGYAGSRASGFPDEVRQEELLARVGDLSAMFFDHARGIRAAGPMAEELEAEFEMISREIGTLPGEVVDEKGLRKHLRSLAATMRVGTLADCFFDPGRARCLEHLSPERRLEPVTGLCDPRCERACWAGRHVGAWQQLLQEAERYARVNSISAQQRTVLRSQATLARRVLSEIPGPHHGG